MKANKNYARFWTLLNQMPGTDRNELKGSLIAQFTSNRTDSLKEMTDPEYDAMCESMQRSIGKVDLRKMLYAALKRKRSSVLHQMQTMGIDTADWNKVDEVCQHPRIACKPFRELSADELDDVLIKLRIIQRKRNNQSVSNN